MIVSMSPSIVKCVCSTIHIYIAWNHILLLRFLYHVVSYAGIVWLLNQLSVLILCQVKLSGNRQQLEKFNKCLCEWKVSQCQWMELINYSKCAICAYFLACFCANLCTYFCAYFHHHEKVQGSQCQSPIHNVTILSKMWESSPKCDSSAWNVTDHCWSWLACLISLLVTQVTSVYLPSKSRYPLKYTLLNIKTELLITFIFDHLVQFQVDKCG